MATLQIHLDPFAVIERLQTLAEEKTNVKIDLPIFPYGRWPIVKSSSNSYNFYKKYQPDQIPRVKSVKVLNLETPTKEKQKSPDPVSDFTILREEQRNPFEIFRFGLGVLGAVGDAVGAGVDAVGGAAADLGTP